MSSLLTLQWEFTENVALFITAATKIDYRITFAEAYRTPEQAAINARRGSGIENSLHCVRLAIDLNIFKNGKWLRITEDLALLGGLWKSMHPLARWGGDFEKPDGNHFSFEYNERK